MEYKTLNDLTSLLISKLHDIGYHVKHRITYHKNNLAHRYYDITSHKGKTYRLYINSTRIIVDHLYIVQDEFHQKPYKSLKYEDFDIDVFISIFENYDE